MNRPLLVVVLLALALHAPCLRWGFFTDDYGLQAVLRLPGVHPDMRPWDLYDFGDRPEPDSPLGELAAVPWWTAPDWEVRFFRPLTSLSLALDTELFGDWAVGHHLSGLALFALLLWTVHRLYRALGLPRAAALLGLALFAAENGSVLPVGWMANRNSLLATLFTTAALATLLGGRRPGGPRALAGALGLGLCACLCKESGIAVFLLIPAGLLRAPPGRVRFATAAGLSLLVAAAYLAFLLGLGYGANSLFYPTPWGEPLEVLRRFAVLLPAGLLALGLPVPLDLLFTNPGLQLPAALVAAAVVLPLGTFLWRRVRAHPAAGLLALWVAVSLLPQAGAPISDRLLFGASVGSSALLALFVTTGPPLRPLRAGSLASWLVLAGAGLASAGVLLGAQETLRQVANLGRAVVLDAELGPGTPPREVLMLQVPSALTALNPGPTWLIERGEPRVRFWSLQYGRRALGWTGVDERTFELESLDAPFLKHLSLIHI